MSKVNKRVSAKNILLFLAVGCIFAIPAIAYKVFFSKPPDPIEREARLSARNSGLPEVEFRKILTANAHLDTNTLSETDWQAIQSASQAPEIDFRCLSALRLWKLSGTKYEKDAADTLARLANDPDAGTKTLAIRGLFRMKDARAHELLKSALSSSDPSMQSVARKIASQYDPSLAVN